jgi:hypothetical protein
LVKYTTAKIYLGKEDEFLLKERRELLYTMGYPFDNFQGMNILMTINQSHLAQ